MTARYRDNLLAGGQPAQVADKILTDAVSFVPEMLVGGMYSKAAKAAATTAQLAKNAAAQMTKATGIQRILNTAGNAVESALTDPAFRLTFGWEAASSYAKAKEDGASDLEAAYFAISSGFLEAFSETGLDTGLLPKELPTEKRTLQRWISDMLAEGNEAVILDVLKKTMENVTYDKGNALFSVTDTSAVFNPAAVQDEWVEAIGKTIMKGTTQQISAKKTLTGLYRLLG